jgi:outer membrane phospholipase A
VYSVNIFRKFYFGKGRELFVIYWGKIRSSQKDELKIFLLKKIERTLVEEKSEINLSYTTTADGLFSIEISIS